MSTSLKYDLEVTNSLIEELKDIVTTIWAEELLEGGFDSVHEHLMYHDFKPVEEWTAKELINQIVEDTYSYWCKECQWTDLGSLVRLDQFINKTFSTIELAKLVLKVEIVKQKISATSAS